MAGSHAKRVDLTEVLARFPADGALIRRLILRDETFRVICEDYVLARASLSWFEALPDGDGRREVADFQALIPGLEVEIEQFLQKSRQSS